MKINITPGDWPHVPRHHRNKSMKLPLEPDWALLIMAKGEQLAITPLHDIKNIQILVDPKDFKKTQELTAYKAIKIGKAIVGEDASFEQRTPRELSDGTDDLFD